jgi:hypothetical protein
VYWRYYWKVSWGVYRRIQKAPALDWFDIDLILTEYHRRHGLVREGLERARSRLDNRFAQHDGRARRLSSASTVEHGDWARYARVVQREKTFQRGRAAWIDQQPNAEEQYQSLSNLHEVLDHSPPARTRENTPHVESGNPEQDARAAQRASVNRRRDQLNEWRILRKERLRRDWN